MNTRTYKEAVNTTLGFFKDGYSTKDLQDLQRGLDVIGIKGDSTLSVKRLITGLQNAKSLNRLDDSIEERGKTLETLNSKINVAEGILSAYEKKHAQKIRRGHESRG